MRILAPVASVAVAIAVLIGTAARASAQERSMARLVYARDPGASRCPDEAEVRDAVSARLGYVPFVDEGGLAIAVRIESSRAGLRAVVDVADHGVVVGHRVLTSATRDCGELARAFSLAISVAIDPMVLLGPAEPTVVVDRPAPIPPPEPAPPEPTAIVEPPAPIPPPPAPPPPPSVAPEPPRSLRLGGVVGVAYGAVPAVRPFFGVAFERELVIPSVAVRTEVRWDAPASTTDSYGTVSATRVDARALGCFGVPHIVGCPGLAIGGVFARGSEIAPARRGSTWTAAIVLDAASRFDLGHYLTLEVRAGIDLALRPVSLELASQSVYTNPRISPHLGLAAMWRIL